jgi:hypothetical protein
MSDQEPTLNHGPAHEPWGPLPGRTPVEEYGLLADELQACYPEATAQQLDLLVAREMAGYGGHSVETITWAMSVASLALASGTVSNARDYVARTVAEAMQQEATDETVLGWDA